MTITQKLTFAEYLAMAGSGLQGRAELIDGELIELPPESGLNLDIATFLQLALIHIGISFQLIHVGRCELQVPVLERGDAANRYPDVVVLRSEHLALTRQRMTITLEMPPPCFVIEVVSPGKTNRDRDYVRKRAQYAAVGIPEYWIIDPEAAIVVVHRLEGNDYQQEPPYQGIQRIHSLTFPALDLNPKQIFALGQ